jgi:hypothetical protein
LCDGELLIPRVRALELLSDDLRQTCVTESDYENRIWNAESLEEETCKILDELTVCVFEMVIDELTTKMNYVDKKWT